HRNLESVFADGIRGLVPRMLLVVTRLRGEVASRIQLLRRVCKLMTTDKDLFDDSTMTFGEHLEVLRFHLIRAILGLVICVIFSLIFGEQLVQLIRQPIDRALKRADFANSKEVVDIKGFSFW